MQVPLCHVQLNNIYHNLERHDSDLEEEIVNEIVNFDTIQFGDNCFFIVDPQEKHKERGIEKLYIVTS